jgi:hypothetical protein
MESEADSFGAVKLLAGKQMVYAPPLAQEQR